MASNNDRYVVSMRCFVVALIATLILYQFFVMDERSVLQPATPSVSNRTASRSEGNSLHQATPLTVAYDVPATQAPVTQLPTTTTGSAPLTTIARPVTDIPYNFSMGNTPACAKHLREDDQTLIDIASAVVDYHYSLNATEKLTKAKEAWSMILEDCHGPIPPQAKLHYQLKDNLFDPLGWLQGLLKCADRRGKSNGGWHNLFGGEWCNSRGRWHGNLRRVVRSADPEKLSIMFVDTARCMLHMEFPLLPQQSKPPHEFTKSATAVADTVILVTLAATSTDVKKSCGLLASAVARGWETTIGIGSIEGSSFGLKLKYYYAIETIQQLFSSRPELNPDKTVIVFSDGHDTLANVEPGHVLEMFQKQPYDFVWSSEQLCFPVGLWPHNLGAPTYTCDVLFPSSSNETLHEKRNTPQFVNTGGWIALASTALQVLAELSHVTLSIPAADSLQKCHDRATDQLLGNVHLLRHYSSGRIGLDVDSNMFLCDSHSLYREGKINVIVPEKIMSNSSQEEEEELRLLPQACFDVPGSKSKCSAFLHFNGCGSECVERFNLTNALTPMNFRSTILADGQVTVVDLTSSTVTKLPNIDICFPP